MVHQRPLHLVMSSILSKGIFLAYGEASMMLERLSCIGLVLMLMIGICFGQEKQDPSLTTGSIRGIVLDGDGKPLPDATVMAIPENGGLRAERRATTNAEGRFLVEGLPGGISYLQAFKESDGYPYNLFAFYLTPGEKMPNKVLVAVGQTTEGAVIQMGERAGYLALTVQDEKGTQLKTGFTVTFSRPDQPGGDQGPNVDPHKGLPLDYAKPLMVPPVPFRVTINRDGYQPWHYGGSQWQSDAGLIHLKSGEVFALKVDLQLAQPNPTGSTGSVVGILSTPDGDPVASAQVRVVPTEGPTDGGANYETLSSASGRFLFNGLPPGTYHYSIVGVRGYIPAMFSSEFFQQPGSPLPTFTVDAGAVTRADLQLGPPAGNLSISVTNRGGVPIRGSAHLLLTRADNSEKYEKDLISFNLILVPTLVPMRLTVEAPGFIAWHYGGDHWQDSAGILQLAPGRSMVLRVELVPTQ